MPVERKLRRLVAVHRVAECRPTTRSFPRRKQQHDDATRARRPKCRVAYITHASNGIKFTQLERQHLKRIRYQDTEKPVPKEVTAA